ncbi:MAG: hypothetical protein ABS897_07125, partial [Eubacteriales bacterium]
RVTETLLPKVFFIRAKLLTRVWLGGAYTPDRMMSMILRGFNGSPCVFHDFGVYLLFSSYHEIISP